MSEKQTSASEVEAHAATSEHVYNTAEKTDYDREGAIDAEVLEHSMTVLEAVKAYPAASWWAFVMSCTIVSSDPSHAGHFSNIAPDYGVLLCFLNGPVHRDKKVCRRLWCEESTWGGVYHRSLMAVSIPM